MTSAFLARIVGPVILLRGLSLLIDRQHFVAMVDGLEDECHTVSFSFVPVALMMAALAVLQLHADRETLAGLAIHLAAWGMLLKASALVLAPRLVVVKAQALVRSGFLHVVTGTSCAVGGYLCWFGYSS